MINSNKVELIISFNNLITKVKIMYQLIYNTLISVLYIAK